MGAILQFQMALIASPTRSPMRAILMDKVESVDVDQSIMGRLLDYGTAAWSASRAAALALASVRIRSAP
jgi:hypothetical protein